MSGENSKKSGEDGEKLADAFLHAIGWKQKITKLSIPCTDDGHVGQGGSPRKSHGDDRVFIYNNPFYESRTDVVHVSVKNNANGYAVNPGEVRSELKANLLEANEIITCAQYDSSIHDLTEAFPSRKRFEHTGLLIWTSSHNESFARDILPDCVPARGLDDACIHNVHLVDGGRIHFILTALAHADRDKDSTYRFFYPDTGLVNKGDERHGTFLPLELLMADILPLKVKVGDKELLHLYVRQPFDEEAYARAIALALTFTGGWGKAVRVGFPDYNEAQHKIKAERAKLPFHDREPEISVFCYVLSNLNALETD